MYENPILATILALKDVNPTMTMNYLEHELSSKSQKYFAFEDICMSKIPELIEELKEYRKQARLPNKRVISESSSMDGTFAKHTIDTIHLPDENSFEEEIYDSDNIRARIEQIKIMAQDTPSNEESPDLRNLLKSSQSMRSKIEKSGARKVHESMDKRTKSPFRDVSSRFLNQQHPINSS